MLPRINGRKPAVSTLWRWWRKGLRGVQLEYLRMGRSIVTSREALNRFFAALAAVDERPAPEGKPDLPGPQCRRPRNSAREQSLQRARRRLAEAGI